MSYDCTLIESNIFISQKDSIKAFNIIKDNSEDKIRNVDEAFNHIGFDVEYDNDANIIKFIGENCGLYSERPLSKIAHLVKPGSCLTIAGEEGDMWRWVFDGKTCKTIEPKISWD